MGDTLWTRTIGESYDEQATDVQETQDGGYIICGTAENAEYEINYYLVKTDSQGDTIWTRTYGPGGQEQSFAKSVRQTADKGYILAGFVDDYTYAGGTGYIYLVKTDSSGHMLWTKKYDWSSYDMCFSVRQTAEGGYIVVGYTSSQGAGGPDFFLMKTDEQGDSLWLKTYGGTVQERAFSSEITSDGGYVLCGFTSTYGAGFFDFYLVRTDSNGDTLWTRTYGGGNQEQAYDVEQTADGGYVLTGDTYSFGAGTHQNVYLVKTDANGLITEISAGPGHAVTDFHLYQNYPNPFNPVTTISYNLNKAMDINLSIYDTEGRLVNTLINTGQFAGNNSIQWSGIDNKGNKVSSGIYFCSLKADDVYKSVKMVLLR